MIVAYVRKTGNKAMACAEMTYQIELAKEELVDPLPDDVKKKVVWRDTFWLPDEAASIYSKAQAVVSMECHSPLISLHNGTPAIYVRQPTDTCKGQMYRDFGSGDWSFGMDQTSGGQLWSRLDGDSSQSGDGQITGPFHHGNGQSAAKAHGGHRQAGVPRLMPSPTFQRPREDLRQWRAIATEITCRAGESLLC